MNKNNINKSIQVIISFLTIIALLISCKKAPAPEAEKERGTVTDIDGNIYNTVKIGDQWWMVENLKVKKYNDGTAISFIDKGDTDKWAADTTGAYCSYPDGSGLGFLYNGYAAGNSKKIAPEGWRIPSDNDWKELEKYLGMNAEDADKTGWRGTHEGEKLMQQRTTIVYWAQYGDIWPTNESEFSALAGGCRIADGRFGSQSLQHTGFWWSSTTQGNECWYRYLDYKNATIFRSSVSKSYGYSIRCIKN